MEEKDMAKRRCDICEKGDRDVGVQVCAKPTTRNISYPAGL